MTRRTTALALCLLCLWAACRREEAGKGGLVAVIESDLLVPKDLDRVSLRVRQYERTLSTEERDFASSDGALPQRFSLTLAGTGEVTLIAVGYKEGIPRAQRTAIVKVPSSYVGMVRLPLNFLCEHMVTAEGGSSCGADNTCIQGLCGPARLNDVPHDRGPAETPGASDAGAVPCFDPLSCFAGSQEVELDRATCSFELDVDPDTSSLLNVALKLPPISAGACGSDQCLIVLSPGDADGWTLQNGARIVLSMGICHAMADLNFSVLLSRRCPPRQRSTVLCVTGPEPRRAVGVLPPSGGDACAGSAVEDCGKCGTRQRSCREGQWTAWSECVGGRDCDAGGTRSCEQQGTQSCRADCTWGECLGKRCDGLYAQACGYCGIQSRNCVEGEWSDWSACMNNGECSPKDPARACGGGGTQVCSGTCHWGPCEDQVCPGASTEPCGNCGQRTRTCNSSTGQWSTWSECTGEGVCVPDRTRECPNDGSDACGGDCQWENVCRGQVCTGLRTQGCPMCGTQERSCDSDTGEWGAWGECQDQGECMPLMMRDCQNMGRERCGADCRWSNRCEGQRCVGEPTQACNDGCGTQSRSCNPDTGRWSEWSACEMPAGTCAAGTTSECGSRGTRTCGADCHWGDVCMNQTCSGTAPTLDCGCRESTRGECNPVTGQYSSPRPCSTEPCNCTGAPPKRPCVGCHPATTASCNTETGQWDDAPACMTGPCICMGPAPMDDCGCHGKQPQQCNMVLGVWESQACPAGPCPCAPSSEPAPVPCCRDVIPATCDGTTGKWRTPVCSIAPGQCSCDLAARPADVDCCGSPTRATCNMNTGRWNRPVCQTPAGMCTCEDKPKPKSIMCCGTPRDAHCDPNSGSWIEPVCEIPADQCQCAPALRPSVTCCGKDILGVCDMTTGQWKKPVCTTPADMCECDAKLEPPAISCCSAPLRATCVKSDGHWVAPDCAKGGKCPCSDAKKPESTSCACGAGLQPPTCDTAGSWVPGVCPSPACNPDSAAPRRCKTSLGVGTEVCSRASCTWSECQVTCEPEASTCRPCGQGIQRYTCNANGMWAVQGDCVPSSREVCAQQDSMRDCPIAADGGTGVQYCSGCEWGPCGPVFL